MLLLMPWRSSGLHDVVRCRPDAHHFCEACSDGLHDILRTCPVCKKTPREKHESRSRSGLDDRVYVLFGLTAWCVEGDGVFRPLFPIVLEYSTATDALRAADTTLRAHGVTLA